MKEKVWETSNEQKLPLIKKKKTSRAKPKGETGRSILLFALCRRCFELQSSTYGFIDNKTQMIKWQNMKNGTSKLPLQNATCRSKKIDFSFCVFT